MVKGSRKRKFESPEERRARVVGSSRFSGIMPVPCSKCRERKEACLVDLETGCCSMCSLRRIKCDVVSSNEDWDRLHTKRAKAVQKLLELQKEVDSVEARQEIETLEFRAALLERLRLEFDALSEKHTKEREALRNQRRRFQLELEAADQERASTLHRNLKVLDELEEFSVQQGGGSRSVMASGSSPGPLLPLCPAESLFPTVGSQDDWDFLQNYPVDVVGP